MIKKIAILGGAAVNLCEAQIPLGARWSADDTIVFGQPGVGIMQVSADGGTPEVLIPLDDTTGEVGQPQTSPNRIGSYRGAQGFVFSAVSECARTGLARPAPLTTISRVCGSFGFNVIPSSLVFLLCPTRGHPRFSMCLGWS